jgi:ABC-type transport system involved in multi-copper enzyme maturation permease subunit
VILALFAVGMILLSFPLRSLTVGEWKRLITDVGLGATDLSLTLIAILLGSSLIAGDLDRRTLYPLLAKPISRQSFVIGKFMGLAAVLTGLALAMGGGTIGILFLAFQHQFVESVLQGVGGIVASTLVLGGVGILFSSFTSVTLSVAFGLTLALVGHLTGNLAYFASKSEGTGGKVLGIVVHLLPNLEKLNLKDFAAHSEVVPASDFLIRMAYGLTYALLCVALGAAIFSRRDLK